MKKIGNIVTMISLTIMVNSHAQQKQVCVTVDDLPVVAYGKYDSDLLLEVTDKLISTFDMYEIPAIGYVNEFKLYNSNKLDSNKVELLDFWLKNGYELGNHTFSHYNYHKTSFDAFTQDIIKGEKVTKPLSEKYDKSLTYFRHPFLKTGKTKASADSLHYFLDTHGYQEAPVTIDPDDYLFAKAYHLALNKGDTVTGRKIGVAYLAHMEEKITYYEKVSQQLFGRDISQTLLIHANLLNADYLDEVAELFHKYGYTFISQQEVLRDEAYNEPVTKYGDWGISWMDRWTISQGKSSLLKNDPTVPDFIMKLSSSK